MTPPMTSDALRALNMWPSSRVFCVTAILLCCDLLRVLKTSGTVSSVTLKVRSDAGRPLADQNKKPRVSTRVETV